MGGIRRPFPNALRYRVIASEIQRGASSLRSCASCPALLSYTLSTQGPRSMSTMVRKIFLSTASSDCMGTPNDISMSRSME